MSALTKDKPAFPIDPKVHELSDMEGDVLSGMDMRDYFAIRVLAALLNCEQGRMDRDIAKVSYQYADDMMKAREKP